MKEYLRNVLAGISVDVTDEQAEKLLAYKDLVLKYNELINLTRITEDREFIQKHLADSLSVSPLEEYQSAEKICDMGTGAGFPGVPLAILNPEKKFYLVDSLAKRLRAVGEMTDVIGLENIYLVHSRAEDAGQGKAMRETFDLCLSRAVADLRVLTEYCLPMVKIGGNMIAYKGTDPEEELNRAHAAIRILGGKTKRIVPVNTEEFSHTLLIINKVKRTPKTYPRKAGTPSKSPI